MKEITKFMRIKFSKWLLRKRFHQRFPNYPNFLLARANLRRAKGETASIAVLILLAACMLNLWLMLSLDYKQNFDRYHDKLNAEHVTLVADGEGEEFRDFLIQTMENDERTVDFSLDDSMHMVGLFGYSGGEINSELVILEKQSALSRLVGRIEIVEEGSFESGIYMPMLYKSEEIAVGKTIQVSIGGNKISYTICGFFNSVMAGSHNCAMCEMIVTEDKYRELQELGYAPKSILCSVRLSDKEESESYESMLKSEVSSRYPAMRTVSNSYTLVEKSRYISQMICSSIVSAMAFFILLIALVVIASSIVNYIGENMKNLGALKAVGYTSNQLIGALLLQFFGVTLLVALAGICLSYACFPAVNQMMVSQTGIPYAIRFLPMPFLLTLMILGGAVALAVFLSSHRIKKVEPIVALRQGIRTHSFRRNHIPLERTKAPLHVALALKTTLSEKKHNVVICITMLVLSLVVVFSGVMIRNMIMDMAPFLNMIVGETADCCINISAGAEEEFLQAMREDKRVEKVYLYNSIEVQHVGGVGLIMTMTEDFSDVNNPGIVFLGRSPKYDNEIAVAAKYAKEVGLELGSEITIALVGREADYLISGFTQITNNLGKDCLMTRSGYERLSELQNMSYYLNLSEGADIEAFRLEVKEKFGDEVNATINIDATIEGASSVYVSLMTMIVVAVFVLSVIVIAFVLYLLVRTMLGNKKQEYGILKALGFTTRQLMLQTALSFLPMMMVSTVLGVAVSCMVINPLIALFLSSVGIVKCTFIVPVPMIAAAGAGLVFIAFAIACAMSLKIKRIAPRTLLAGE